MIALCELVILIIYGIKIGKLKKFTFNFYMHLFECTSKFWMVNLTFSQTEN